MKFKELYSMNEKFTGKFSPRDFGDGKINLVDVPEEVGDYARIETYAHNKDMIWSFVFDEENNLKAFIMGSFANPAGKTELVDDAHKMNMYMQQYPANKSAFAEYSGVEPIKPPFAGYSGTYHIPKEFNMTKFAPVPTGVRTDTDWTLN